MVPVHDSRSTVLRTVQSVLHQTEPRIEVIVVDDGSSDDSAATVAAVDDPRVVVRQQANRGPGAARNAGAALAQGPVLAFVDSDDEVDHAWVERLLAAMADTSCAAACCGARRRYADGRDEDIVLPAPMGPAFAGFTGLFNAGTFAIRASAFSAIGGYEEQLRFGENTELGLRLTHWCRDEGRTIAAVDEALLSWNIRAQRAYPPGVLLAAAAYTLAHHGAALSTDRTMLADYLAICGVNAARLGELGAARRHFARSLRARPSLAAAARLGAAVVPAVSRRVWPAGRQPASARS